MGAGRARAAQLDHLGTPMELTNEFGHTVWAANYSGFGQAKVVNASHTAVKNSIRYQGQYCDEEIGLHYNRFRYYDYLSGQYTQQDPIGLDGGDLLNQYVSNPVTWIDPLGLQGVCPNAIAQKYGGKKIGNNRYQMPNKKSAKQAASEIAGNMGSKPTTIPRSQYRDVSNTYKDKMSNKVIGKHSSDNSSGYHDHSIGHNFDRRPHINAWSKGTNTTMKDNVHLYY